MNTRRDLLKSRAGAGLLAASARAQSHLRPVLTATAELMYT